MNLLMQTKMAFPTPRDQGTDLRKGAKKIGEIIFAGQKKKYMASVVAPLASLREFQNEHMS